MAKRTFKTNFTSVDEFPDFYIVPPGDYDTIHSLKSSPQPYHHAEIVKARDIDNESTPEYLPHRGYQAYQFHKLPDGGFVKPTVTSLFVRVGASLKTLPGIDDWISLFTMSTDSSDNWTRTILVNLSADGYLRLVHVPDQGQQIYVYQNSQPLLKFPKNRWVRLDLFLDVSSVVKQAILFQEGKVVSKASLINVSPILQQAHFGLYASARLPYGYVDNAYLRVNEIDNEADIYTIINSPIEP